jgi:hypothetical protein
MKLADIVVGLDTSDDSLCIVAKRPWTGDSEAKLGCFTNDFRVPEEARSAGYEYFLEVSTARDEVLSGPVPLSDEQKVEAVIYYAENDAFPDWLNTLGSKQ